MLEWSGSWHHLHTPKALTWLLSIGIGGALDDGAVYVTVYNKLLIESVICHCLLSKHQIIFLLPMASAPASFPLNKCLVGPQAS